MVNKWGKARESPDEIAMGNWPPNTTAHFLKGVCAGVRSASSERGTSLGPTLATYSLALMHHGLAKNRHGGEASFLTLKLRFLHCL